MMPKSRPHPDQLAIDWENDPSIEAIIEARVAKRAEAAALASVRSGRGTSRAYRPVTRAAPDRDGIRPDAAPSSGRATSTPPVQRRGAARTSRGAHATPQHDARRRPQRPLPP